MLWTQMRILIPSFVGFWAFLACLGVGAWYGFTRIYTTYAFKWHGPVIAATVVSVFMGTSTFLTVYQNTVINAYQQKLNQDAQAAQQQQTQQQEALARQQAATQQQQAQAQQPVDPALQLKANFLATVESLVQNPTAINTENKKKLFTEYATLFPKKSDREAAGKAVSKVYNCQRLFWEDAMASYKAHQVVKSDARKECETMAGTFFNREKLLPDEVIKSNEATISVFAERKRIPAADGKSSVEVNETMLRNALDAQVKATDAIKKIFN